MTTDQTFRGMPDGIVLDRVHWRCDRCGHGHTWVPDADNPDPLAAAVASAWRHDADHRMWAAERPPTTTTEETR